MERIQVNRFSFRRKGSARIKEKEQKAQENQLDFDFERMSYLR